MIVLMIISFISLWIMVGNSEREPNWRLALVQTLIVWAGYLILGTEVLGYFNTINRVSLSVMWTLPILLGAFWIWIWLKQGRVLRLPVVYHRDSRVGTILDLFVILILLFTAIVAFVSPPNSNEAMVSRMSRVAHWAQNQSLAHFPTGIEEQNSSAPGAEVIALNFYVLRGNDRPVNLVAWLSFAGVVAAAASLAEVFGAKVNAQRTAAIFAATLPSAIAQSTGMLNDLAAAFWVMSAVLMLLVFTKQSRKPIYLVMFGVAAGLAVLTKPIAVLFLFPFGVYLIGVLWLRLGMIKTILWSVLIAALVLLFNGGYYHRQQETYDQLYPPGVLTEQINESRNWRITLSNITRNAALHADLPFPRADDWLFSKIKDLHQTLGLDLSDPRTTLGEKFYIPEVNTSELTSGNPVHAGIIVLSLTAVVGMVLLAKQDPDILIYLGAVFLSVILFCYFLKWQPSGSRLQLPYFLLFAPMLAVLMDRLEKFELEIFLAVMLLIFAMPWLFQTQERPIIPNAPRTFPLSVFNENNEPLYFATNPQDHQAYRAIAGTINQKGITQVGFNLQSTSEEYPFWALLNEPLGQVRMAWVDTQTPSKQYLDDRFSPDAIICELCSSDDITRYSETYQRLTYGAFDLFIRE